MKKRMTILMLTMAFMLTLGTAYASEGLYNGVTDFTGRSYEDFELARADADNSVESENAGGMREEGKPLYNGVTDFTGRSYDNFEIGMAGEVTTVEDISAGGLREKDKAPHNGVTDFSGKSYESFEM
jgi:hypothetical protein